jgi:hypothetical protein
VLPAKQEKNEMTRKEQPAKNHLFKWVRDPRCEKGTGTLLKVGIYADGTLRNPHGYPEDVVREAVAAAVERDRAWRSEMAKANAPKAAETRKLRRKYKINKIAADMLAGIFKPGKNCGVCGRGLTDPESRKLGIGPECRAPVYSAMDRKAREKEEAAKAPPPEPPSELQMWLIKLPEETRAELLRRREAGEDKAALFKEYGAPIAA